MIIFILQHQKTIIYRLDTFTTSSAITYYKIDAMAKELKSIQLYSALSSLFIRNFLVWKIYLLLMGLIVIDFVNANLEVKTYMFSS